MTISTSAPLELDIDNVVTMAFRQAALANPYEAIAEQRKQHGRLMLDMALKSLSTEGLFAKTTTFETVTLVSGQTKYMLSPATLSVRELAKYTAATEDPDRASSELPVMPINHLQWQELVTKTLQSHPFQYYANRVGALIEVWLWPEPGATEAGAHVRFKVERLRANTIAGADTLDAESYWELCLVYELAFHLAVGAGLPEGRCGLLKAEAMELRAKCAAKGREEPTMQPDIMLVNRWR